MLITFLGTNGWYDSDMGNSTSILVNTADFNIILDAGNGFAKIYKYIDETKPVYLFISHLHLDHIIGLHTLQLNKFSQGLHILLQEGSTEQLNAIMKKPYTTPIMNLPFKVEFIEVPNDIQKLPFKCEFLQMTHSVPTLGIRLEIDEKVIAYTADTAFCENAITLAKEADVLISECAFRPNEEYQNSPHLNPQQAAQLAKQTNAKKLYLMHFDARRYPDLEARVNAEKAAQAIFTETYYTTDEMQIEL